MIRLFEEKQNMYARRTWVGQVDFPPDTDTEGRGLNRGPLSGPQKGALCVGAWRTPLLRHNVVIIKLGLLMAKIQILKTLWCIMLKNELMICFISKQTALSEKKSVFCWYMWGL